MGALKAWEYLYRKKLYKPFAHPLFSQRQQQDEKKTGKDRRSCPHCLGQIMKLACQFGNAKEDHTAVVRPHDPDNSHFHIRKNQMLDSKIERKCHRQYQHQKRQHGTQAIIDDAPDKQCYGDNCRDSRNDAQDAVFAFPAIGQMVDRPIIGRE